MPVLSSLIQLLLSYNLPLLSFIIFLPLVLSFFLSLSIISSSDSVVPWIATELSIGAIFVIVVAFLITLDIVEKHDDIGPIENYQQFFNILHDKEYFVSTVDRFSQHLNFDA